MTMTATRMDFWEKHGSLNLPFFKIVFQEPDLVLVATNNVHEIMQQKSLAGLERHERQGLVLLGSGVNVVTDQAGAFTECAQPGDVIKYISHFFEEQNWLHRSFDIFRFSSVFKEDYGFVFLKHFLSADEDLEFRAFHINFDHVWRFGGERIQGRSLNGGVSVLALHRNRGVAAVNVIGKIDGCRERRIRTRER